MSVIAPFPALWDRRPIATFERRELTKILDLYGRMVSAGHWRDYALTELFKQFGAVELNVALTALIIGSALLLLSAYWHQARRLIVTRLPSNLQARLPNLDRTVVISQQAA